MTVRWLRHSRIVRDRRGYSALIGTIILILVVMFLFYNVYMFSLSRDADYQNIVSRSQQLDADRAAESLRIQSASKTVAGNTIAVTCSLSNNGSVPIQVVRLWLKDSNPSINVVSLSLMSQSVVLQPGVSIQRTFSVTVPGADRTDSFTLTLVTSRGNVVTTFT